MNLATGLTLTSLLAINATAIVGPLGESGVAGGDKPTTVEDTRNAESANDARIGVTADGPRDVELPHRSGAGIDVDSNPSRYSISDIPRKAAEHLGRLSPSITVSSETLPQARHDFSVLILDGERSTFSPVRSASVRNQILFTHS